jgi:Bifunctional DNA primase/polymerase, N-terminal
MTQHLDSALHYAALGWPVHPVNLQKKPTTAHGFKDATTDEATIRAYFSNGAQISIRTGEASGVFVLDIDHDPAKGYDVDRTLALLDERYGPLPHTPHQRTGRGGLQYFFTHQDGLRNKAGTLIGPGVDTRGEGGYVVVAPSRNTHGRYEWIVSPDDTPLADVPPWLIELMTTKERPATSPPAAHDTTAYARAALAGELSNLARAADGTRNDALNCAAFSLGQLVGAGALGRSEVESALAGVATAIGLAPREISATIRSGLDAGESDPRTIPDRPVPAAAQHDEPPHPADEGTADDDARPAIDISTIDLPTLMPQAWAAIVAQNDPPTLFRRAGELARLESTESGALIVKTIDTRVMMGILARAARWVRVTYARGGARVEKETLPPTAVVDDAMVNIDPRIPPITRVVSAPTFADVDTLLTTPGYHAATRVYYDPKPGAIVPAVPDQPTVVDLARARNLVLDELLVNFPFVSDADQAHAVALFLLPFVRELIGGPTPLHLIEAPTMGSGKGLLADALLLPALGETPSPMAEASTDEEWGKVITSNLLDAPAVICIDNLNKMLASSKLAAALTAREFSDRVLGRSEQVHLPVRCVWVATANNPTLSTEISRRCIRIRIDPRVDRPWDREGFRHPKLRGWVEANRGQLIWAALTICRYGLQHGTAGRPLGSYEAWSDVIGRILAGAGFSGFLGNLDALYDRADVEGAAWRALIAAWWQQHQGTPIAASALFPLVAETEADVLISGKDDDGRKKSFGKALARAQDRVFSVEGTDAPTRLQVVTDGIRHKAKLWKLVPMEEGGIGCLGGFSQPHARENNLSTSPAKENTQYTHNTPSVVAGEKADLPPITAAERMAARHRREQEVA